MRTRDQFAMAAMAALIASTQELATTEGYAVNECAYDAYLYADAMLIERKRYRTTVPLKTYHKQQLDRMKAWVKRTQEQTA